MTGKILRSLTVMGWLISFAWLLQSEVLPRWFPGKSSGYRSLIHDAAEVRETWMRILMNGKHVGYTRSFYDLNEETPDPQLAMNNNTLVNLYVMGSRIQVQILSEIVLDSGYRVQEFQFITSLDNHHYRIKGVRKEGNDFALEMTLPNQDKVTSTFSLPEDAVIFNPSMEMSLRKLKPGQTLRINSYDPISGGVQAIRVKALRKENITILGKELPSLRLQAEAGGLAFTLWADEQGQILRQETPFGWTMEVCQHSEAVEGIPMSPPTRSIIPEEAIAPLLKFIKPNVAPAGTP